MWQVVRREGTWLQLVVGSLLQVTFARRSVVSETGLRGVILFLKTSGSCWLLVLSRSTTEACYKDTFGILLLVNSSCASQLGSLAMDFLWSLSSLSWPGCLQYVLGMAIALFAAAAGSLQGEFWSVISCSWVGLAVGPACALPLCCSVLQAAVTGSGSLIPYCSPQMERLHWVKCSAWING